MKNLLIDYLDGVKNLLEFLVYIVAIIVTLALGLLFCAVFIIPIAIYYKYGTLVPMTTYVILLPVLFSNFPTKIEKDT